jgi:hypothetical protein
VPARSLRPVLLSLPFLTVAVVCFAIFFVGDPRPYVGARVYGGPTEGATHLALRVQVLERMSDLERSNAVGPIGVELAIGDGRRAVKAAGTDEAGMASVNFDLEPKPISGPVELTVSRPGRNGVLAHGFAELAPAEWLRSLHQLGGWLPGKKKGALIIRVALGHGTCAVPFSDPLVIDVRDAKGPVAGAKIALDADGLKLTGDNATGENGRALLSVAPKDSVASLTVRATAPDGATGEWYAMIPVAVGALHARVAGNELVVESAVTLDRAFWALESEREKLSGGIVTLEPDGRGGARGSVEIGALPSPPVWGVVSREPELDSASTVGWPIAQSDAGGEPGVARAVPDRLLLDGLIAGERAEAARRAEAKLLAFGFSALAAVLAIVLLVLESRRSAERLARHLRSAGADASEIRAMSPRAARLLGLGVALICVAMGFAVVALIAMYRVG